MLLVADCTEHHSADVQRQFTFVAGDLFESSAFTKPAIVSYDRTIRQPTILRNGGQPAFIVTFRWHTPHERPTCDKNEKTRSVVVRMWAHETRQPGRMTRGSGSERDYATHGYSISRTGASNQAGRTWMLTRRLSTSACGGTHPGRNGPLIGNLSNDTEKRQQARQERVPYGVYVFPSHHKEGGTCSLNHLLPQTRLHATTALKNQLSCSLGQLVHSTTAVMNQQDNTPSTCGILPSTYRCFYRPATHSNEIEPASQPAEATMTACN